MNRTSFPNACEVSSIVGDKETKNGCTIGIGFGIHGLHGDKTKYMINIEDAKTMVEALTKAIEKVEKGA